MPRSAALDAALALMERPAAVRDACAAPLPGGVTLLLQVAVGDSAALRAAQTMSGRSVAAVQAAAGFYIEQILFHAQADYYRTLGVSMGASRNELRQHMALLAKWLHPDGHEQRVGRSDLDRGIFIHRVTKAWENLKSDERRAAYDRLLSGQRAKAAASPPRHGRPRKTAKKPRRAAERPQVSRRPAKPPQQRGRRYRRLVIHLFENDSLITRMFTYLWLRI
jgi:DnaJ domain